MNIIICSKDRPMQLYALLESIDLFWKDKPKVDLFITYNNECYFKPYFNVIDSFHDLINTFIIKKYSEEYLKEFQQTILSIINNIQDNYLMFCPDDGLFIRPVEIDYTKFDISQLITYSLRLGKNINYTYPLDLVTFSPKINLFEYRLYEGDFNYPMALDGHIFRKKDIFEILYKSTFVDPRSMEIQMMSNKPNNPLMYMNDTSCFISTPCNSTQEDKRLINRNMNSFSTLELNNIFNQNKKIDITPFLFINNNSCFVEKEYTFVWR
jgi:hypothetical protein